MNNLKNKLTHLCAFLTLTLSPWVAINTHAAENIPWGDVKPQGFKADSSITGKCAIEYAKSYVARCGTYSKRAGSIKTQLAPACSYDSVIGGIHTYKNKTSNTCMFYGIVCFYFSTSDPHRKYIPTISVALESVKMLYWHGKKVFNTSAPKPGEKRPGCLNKVKLTK